MPANRARAQTAREARWNCEVFPLDEGRAEWYVDLQEQIGLRRGGTEDSPGVSPLVDEFDPNRRPVGHWLHFALAGPRGSGKSTLVQQSFPRYREMGLYPVHVDVLESLDPSSISYSDLLLTLLVAVDAALEAESIPIAANARDEVLDWFNERILTAEHVRELGLELKTTAQAGATAPFIGKLLARITASFKGGSRYREEIRQRIDTRPNELLDKLNFYLDAVGDALRARHGRGELVVFFDNLEKISNAPEQVDNALIQRASLFRSLRCHGIYTLPFGLLSAPRQGGLPGDAFSTYVVPMVALRRKTDPRDHLDPAALAAFREILERRMVLDAVFESPPYADDLVRASGGCPRDLLRLTLEACQYAGNGRVSASHVREAIRRVGQEHVRTIVPGDWERLVQVHLDKQIQNDADHHRLIYHRLVLHYDDVVWDDVHPLIWPDERFERAWQAARVIQSP